MLHTCVQRFDVTGNLEKFCKILGTKQALSLKIQHAILESSLTGALLAQHEDH